MGRKNRQQPRRQPGTHRGIRRSIRYDAVEEERDTVRKRAADAPVEINLRRMRAEDALGQLAATIAHEVRNPLAVIRSAAPGSMYPASSTKS